MNGGNPIAANREREKWIEKERGLDREKERERERLIERERGNAI